MSKYKLKSKASSSVSSATPTSKVMPNSNDFQNGDDDLDLIDLSYITKPSNNQTNLNQILTDMFTRFMNQLKIENKNEKDKKIKNNNGFRIRAIENAISVIKNCDVPITSGKMAIDHFNSKGIKGIGKGISDKIDEILETGTLAELKDVEATEETKAIESLTTIKGVGAKHALDYYNNYHIKDAEDMIAKWKSGELKKLGIEPTHEMYLGLKYYHDFLVKIPYDEIELFRPIFEPILDAIDPYLRYEIAGSHRRGKALSGDIDILVTHTKISNEEELENIKTNYLEEIVNKLKESGVLLDHMTDPARHTIRCACKLDEKVRHVDISIYAYNVWPTAILHGTGSQKFNVELRTIAMKKGYTLSQYGLYKVEDGKKTEMMPVKSERDVFRILKVKYLEPKRREM